MYCHEEKKPSAIFVYPRFYYFFSLRSFTLLYHHVDAATAVFFFEFDLMVTCIDFEKSPSNMAFTPSPSEADVSKYLR